MEASMESFYFSGYFWNLEAFFLGSRETRSSELEEVLSKTELVCTLWLPV